MLTPAEQIRKQEADTLATVKEKAKGVESNPPEFKHIKPECGPCCRAKDNGSGHYVIVTHCDKCHAETHLPIYSRPNH
jgi:hypothetical protein